jgi:molybdopterin biosynthesis enzyme
MIAETHPQRLTRLTPVEDLLALIARLVKPVEPREVELAAAHEGMLGGVLASDVFTGPRPLRPVALRDGWAVAAGLTADAGSYAPIPLDPALRIDTGEPLPPSADAVAPADAVVMRGGRAEIIAPVVAGEGVLAAGADCEAQRPLLRAGTRLNTVNAVVLAAAGATRVRVRAPRICVARARPSHDDVLGAACAVISRAMAAEGAVPSAASAGDLATTMGDAAIDAFITVGGTGSGRNDTSVRTLASIGRVEIHGIALSPGETAAFGMAGGRAVLMIPGRLDAALAAWLVLGRRLVARLTGGVEQQEGKTAVLARKIASPLGMTEVVPVRCRGGQAEPLASGYWPLQAIADANGWIEVPPGSEGYPAGAAVVVRAWP